MLLFYNMIVSAIRRLYQQIQNIINSRIGCRHIQTFLLFLCMVVCFMMRVNMSVAIVAMTNTNATPIAESRGYVETYEWDKKTQDIVLSSFLWGYMLMQIPGGRLAEKYGAKPLLIVTLLVNSFITMMLPLAVQMGDWQGACACRIIQGITQSCIFPGLNTFGSRWFPLSERGRLLGLVASGGSLGTILGMVISSKVAQEYGWHYVFYTFGCLGFVVGIVWCLFASSAPSCHKSISEKEKTYIETSGCTKKTEILKIPWFSIIKSVPYLAIMVAQIGSDFGHVMFFMEIPSYMHNVLNIQISKNGLFSALPYVAAWFITIITSVLSDYFRNNGLLETNVSRKIFNSLGTWIPAVIVIILSYTPPDRPYIIISLLILGVGFTSSVTMGFGLSSLDIAPNFSGTLVGMSNCVSQSISILAPLSVGLILKDDTDPWQWQIIFFMMAAIYFVTNLIFVLFGSSQLQPWNEISATEKSTEGEKKFNNLPKEIQVIVVGGKDMTI